MRTQGSRLQGDAPTSDCPLHVLAQMRLYVMHDMLVRVHAHRAPPAAQTHARFSRVAENDKLYAAEAAQQRQQDALFAADAAAHAATWGNPTAANVVERLHRREREDTARVALIASATQVSGCCCVACALARAPLRVWLALWAHLLRARESGSARP
jgi:hypothetical protein